MKFEGNIIDKMINICSSKMFIMVCFIIFGAAVIVNIFSITYKLNFNSTIINNCFYNRSQLQERSLMCKDGLQCDMYKYSLAQYKCEEMVLSLNK